MIVALLPQCLLVDPQDQILDGLIEEELENKAVVMVLRGHCQNVLVLLFH